MSDDDRPPSSEGHAASLLHRLERAPAGIRASIVLVLLVLIFALDVVTGIELTLRPLYLLPVAAGSWLLGWRAGVGASICSALACVVFDVQGALVAVHRSILYTDGATRLLVYLLVSVLLSRVRSVQEELRHASLRDPLCGIANRRGLERLAERELSRARRSHAPTTLVFIDVDGFKSLNDTRGHAAGDDLLAAVGRALSAGRTTDVAARLGGDEFVLLLPETGEDAARATVERIQSRMTEVVRSGGWPVTFSVGVATFSAPASLEEMIRASDRLMYETKRKGKNGVSYARFPPAIA